jgi:hypothetical protein
MSEKLGPIAFGKREELVFLGREISQSKDYSESTAQIIDEEVRMLVDHAEERAKRLLSENVDKLHMLANTLLEREIMDGDEISRLLRGETLAPLPARGNGRPADGGADGGDADAGASAGDGENGVKDKVKDRTPTPVEEAHMTDGGTDGRREGSDEPSRARRGDGDRA